MEAIGRTTLNLRIHTKELRYMVEDIREFRRLLSRHGLPIEYTPGQPESFLTTLYLDTPEGTWSQGISHTKFRCRTYHNADEWFFELKRRYERVVDKWRRPVSAADLPGIFSGETRWKTLENFLFGEPLIPLFATQYYRTAYEWPGGLRLTVDREVRFFTVNYQPPYSLEERIGGLDVYIIEVKSERRMPEWLEGILVETHVNDFSKSKRALQALRGLPWFIR